jgi:hypothetical protein
MRIGGGAKVAQLALAGGGGVEAEGHGVSLTCDGQRVSESAGQRIGKPAGEGERFLRGIPDG